MLHAGIVLGAVVAAGAGLTFAAVAVACGAEALGGVGEGKGGEEEKHSQRRGHAAAEWGSAGPEDLRNEKGHVLRVLAEKWPGNEMADEGRFGERKVCFVTLV